MTDRPNCLKVGACEAKMKGRHCIKCLLTARNKTDLMRKSPNAKHITPAVQAKGVAAAAAIPKEVRSARMIEAKSGWCPPRYREYNRLLHKQKYTIKQRKKMIADLIKAEPAKARVEIQLRVEAQREKHARQKAQEY